MSLTELQREISEWGVKTFGPAKASRIATRMNVEVAELLGGLSASEDLPPRGEDREASNDHLIEECADVFIILVQVAAALGRDLEDAVNRKMEINRKRVWARTASGMIQHIGEDNPLLQLERAVVASGGTVDPEAFRIAEAFCEEGSGITMTLGKYYVMSDSGSAYTSKGFDSIEAAQEWAAGPEGQAFGIVTLNVAEYDREHVGFENLDAVNLFFADDLKHYWDNQKESA